MQALGGGGKTNTNMGHTVLVELTPATLLPHFVCIQSSRASPITSQNVHPTYYGGSAVSLVLVVGCSSATDDAQLGRFLGSCLVGGSPRHLGLLVSSVAPLP